MRKEERLIVDVPEWAMKSDEEFMKFWDDLMGKDDEEFMKFWDDLMERDGEDE